MKNLIIVVILVFVNEAYSQMHSITSADTLYVLFKSNKFQIKNIFEGSSKSTYLFRQYNFLFTHNEETNFTFYHNEYLEIDTENNLVKSQIITVNKKFLRKHKNAIIGIKYFRKFGVCDSLYRSSTKPKTIYIVDLDERKKGKIILYQASGASRSCTKED